jgi:hypothetical protein
MERFGAASEIMPVYFCVKKRDSGTGWPRGARSMESAGDVKCNGSSATQII